MISRRRFALIIVSVGGAAALAIAMMWRNPRISTRMLFQQDPAEASKAASGVELVPVPGRTDMAVHDTKLARSGATVERIRQMLASIEPVLPGEVENRTALDLLRWWAEFDPAAAIAFASGNPGVHGRTELPLELYGAWLDVKRADAVKWVGALEPGALRSQLLPAIISMVAGEQPLEALRLADELSGENRRTALAALFSEWSALEPRAAAERALRFSDPGEQNLALRVVMGKWMDGDMGAAIAWAKGLPPQAAPDSLDVLSPVTGILLEKWAAQSPAEAAAYVLGTVEGAGRIQQLRTVAGQWAAVDANAAIAWAAEISNETDRQTSVRGVLGVVAQKNVQAAAELALTLRSAAVQEESLRLVIDQWTARDPAGFSAWATTLAARPAAQAMLAPVVASWAGADMSGLGQWLNNLPPGAARDASCAALTRFLAPREPRLAMQWAEAISNPGLRQQQIKALRGGN